MDAKTLNKLINEQIPRRVTDLRIKHLPAFQELSNGNIDLNSMVKFLAKLTFISANELMRVDKDDIIKMYKHCMKMFSGIVLSGNPEKEIIINGIFYDLVIPEKAGIGWHIDVSNSDFDKDPVRLACICYVPKGTNYGDLDQNDNMIHPIASRYKDFEKHFLMLDFIELNAFFLLKLKRLTSDYIQRKKFREQLEKTKKRILSLGKK